MIRRFHEAKVNNAPSVAIWGTGAVLPFLAILTDPARVFAHPSAQPIIQALGLTEPKQLLLPLTIAFGSRVSTREIISL